MSGPRNAEDRLRRLLVMLPWLMETGEVPLAEVARRFDMTEAQVRERPRTGRDVRAAAVHRRDDRRVRRRRCRVRRRAPAVHAFAATHRARGVLAARLGAYGDATARRRPRRRTGRGLAKIAAVLADAGIATTTDSDDTAGVVVDLARPELTDVLAESAATGSELAITYFSPARAEMSSRAIVPRHVYTDGGNWYVVADDDRSHSRRTFRVDRIESAEATGRTVVVEATSPPERFFDDVDLPRVTIRFGPDARWVLDQYPIDEVVEFG